MTIGWGIVIGSLVGASAYCVTHGQPEASGTLGSVAAILIILALWSGDPEPARCCRCCKCEDCDDE